MATVPGAEAPVFLIGFMASGKTTVGSIVAERLRWKFVDLDRVITETAGRSVAQIFAEEEEIGFRRRESQALRDAARWDRCVVATGGGAACDETNLSLMLSSGRVIMLSVSPADAVRRAGHNSGRPLLTRSASGAPVTGLPSGPASSTPADPVAIAARLLANRESFYGRAHHRVDTSDKTAQAVADDVLRLLKVDER